MSQQERGKVLIVGAGLAGLMLAQFLRKEEIPCEIFERDEFVDSRKGGWGISLIEALPVMERLLPDDVQEVECASVNYSTRQLDTMLTYDIMNDKAGFRLGGTAKGQDGYYIRADRQALRRHLWQHLNVHTGKNFERYEQSASGDGITVFFKDGSFHRGTVLVGADGANSRVRRQLVSEENGNAVLSKYIPIWADISLDQTEAAQYKELSNALIIAAAPDVFFALGRRPSPQDTEVSSSPPSTSTQYYWNLCFRSENPDKDAVEVASATAEELYARGLALTENWPHLMRKIVHQYTRPENMSTSPPRFYEFVPPDTLPEGYVTLIGDALHPMVPFRGAGANTAARDAADLVDKIKQTMRSLTDQTSNLSLSQWSTILKDYSKIALPRGKEMVLSSRAAGEQNRGSTNDDPMAELAKGRHASAGTKNQ